MSRTSHPFTNLAAADAAAVLKAREAAVLAAVSRSYDLHGFEESIFLNKHARDSIVFAVLHQGLKDDALVQAVTHLLETNNVLQQRVAILSRCLYDEPYREKLIAGIRSSLPQAPVAVEPPNTPAAVEDDGA